MLTRVLAGASLFKVVVLTGLIILGLIIDLGGVPGQERLGFRYWKESPFSSYLVGGDTGVFLGVWVSRFGANLMVRYPTQTVFVLSRLSWSTLSSPTWAPS